MNLGCSAYQRHRRSKDRPDDQLPPEHTPLGKVFLWAADIALVVCSSLLIAACLIHLLGLGASEAEVLGLGASEVRLLWVYTALTILLASLYIDRIMRHRQNVHDARLEDRSEVINLIQKAMSIEHWRPLQSSIRHCQTNWTGRVEPTIKRSQAAN